MAISFANFSYMENTMKNMNLICVDFDSNNSENISLGLQRSIIKGEINRYRLKSNHISTTYDNPIEFEIHVMKDACKYGYDENEMKFTRNEIRQITKWLSSTTIPQLLTTYNDVGESLNYCGIFTNIESFTISGDVYGFILTFTNDSSFAYTDIRKTTLILNGNTTEKILNDSDLLDDYIYPVIHIHPKSNTDFYMCNLSDCKELDSGTIEINQDKQITSDNFLEKINEFAKINGYTINYYYYGENNFVKTWADNTAMRIKLVERDGTEHYCFTYYLPDGKYKIIEFGFITLKLYADLDIDINCEILTIQDSIGRMVSFKNIGLEEEDYIYWMRLISGYNTILFYANDCTVEIEYRELLKVGV